MDSNSINIILIEQDITVNDFIAKFVSDETFTVNSFLSLKLLKGVVNGINVTNKQRILAQYNAQELQDANNKLLGELIIKRGTEVGLPNDKIKVNWPIPDEVFTFTDYKPFIASKLKELLNDPKYYSELRDNNGQLIGRTDTNDISVYAWIRSQSDFALTPDTPSAIISNSINTRIQDVNGSWVDITPFIETIQTTVTKDGGAFGFTITPISLEEISKVGATDILSSSTISKYKNTVLDNFLVRNPSYFNTFLQENDLIYIRFEKLANENQTLFSKSEFSGNNIPGKIYDMIGLIDRVNESTTPNNKTITVQGRDLMKLLIEDGSYFFVEAFAQNIFTDENSELAQRNIIQAFENSLIQASYSFKSIEVILKFIVNKFSNLGLVPNSVFNAYGNKLTKNKYDLKTSSLNLKEDNTIIKEIDKLNAQERRGVWRIIDFVFDTSATQRILADNGFAQDNGSIINSIRKICQEPFVEFFGDTYGDKYNFVVRKPPFDEISYKGMVYDNVVSEDLLKSGLNVNDRLRSNQIDNELSLRANFGRPSTLSSLVIDIDEAEVISDSLNYSNEVYSWYRIIPRGLGVQMDKTASQLAPVVPFDEYAEVWGNRTYSIEYNYAPAELIQDQKYWNRQNYLERQAFLDLQFLIQSNMYLPFTRQGTITILGNRTIKRGTFIYYKPTDEVFYVNAISHIRTLNERSTTLQVSRGMREKFIKGIEISFPTGIEKVSYFNLINTKIDNDASINNIKFFKNWKVNKNVFNFFLQRKQWIQ